MRMCRVKMNSLWIIVILSSILCLVICETTQSRLVYTSQGPVRGYKYENDDNVYVFYGIPYAKAPTGQERFKAPLEPPVWSEPLEAVNDSIICPQSNIMGIIAPEHKNMQEDCLIANVYMPVTTEEKLPVVVIFHGGFYTIGSGKIENDIFIIKSKQAVVVTFNHRLGAHGFLCLGTKSVPGNAGMKDQVALLRWVNKNIANFGGDPDDVILSGYNTGASSIDLIIMSKMAKGLFKRVILEGGSSISPFTVQFDPIRNARKFAELLKFENVDNFNELESFYKNISYEQLNLKHSLNRPDSTFLMSPCVERDVGEERFLDDNPINILKNGDFEKVPMLYGFLEIQGQFRLPLLDYWQFWMNIRFLEFLPADLQFKDDDEKEEVAEKIKKFYFENKEIGMETTSEFVNYFTDVMFAYPIQRAVKLQIEAGNNQIYLFELSKSLSHNLEELFANQTIGQECSKALGVLENYWKKNQNNEQNVEEINNSKSFIAEMWLNFIVKGEPVPLESQLDPWPPVGAKCSPHMYISKSAKLRGSLLKRRAKFWERIYNKYYRYPIAPTPPQDNI